MITPPSPHGSFPDRRDNFIAALNDGPAQLTGWPAFGEPRFDRTTLQRDANLAALWAKTGPGLRVRQAAAEAWEAAA